MINNRQNGRRRGRGGQQVRNGGGGNGPDRGNRIDNRSRGNAAQLLEKYKNLARDMQMQGDRVMTEYYLQFADHYFRVLSETRSRFEDQNQHPQRRQRDDFDYEDGDEGDGQEAEAAEMAGEDRQDREPRRDDRRERGDRPQPQQAPPRVDYAVEGEQAASGEEDGRRVRRRRARRTEGEDGVEVGGPRIDAASLPPAFASEEKPAPRANGHANGGEPAPAEAAAPEEGAKPARRRTRRAKTDEETGDSSVAA